MTSLKLWLMASLSLMLPLGVAAAGNPPAPAATGATQSWYDIEIIIFSNTDPQAGDLETWPADPGVPDWNAASALIVPATTGANVNASVPANSPTPFMQLERYQLDYDWNRLKHSHDYQPLLHVAWMEPLTDHSTAASVRIGVPPPAPATGTAGLALPQPAPTTTSTVPVQTPTPVYGTVKFSQYGLYLHLDLDLVYHGPLAKHIIAAPAGSSANPAPAAASLAAPAMAMQPQAATDFQWYRMTQDRRIEAGKLNYFDNPMFGVLVLVTPHPLLIAPVK